MVGSHPLPSLVGLWVVAGRAFGLGEISHRSTPLIVLTRHPVYVRAVIARI